MNRTSNRESKQHPGRSDLRDEQRPDLAIQAMVAELTAIRGEITSRIGNQQTLVSGYLTVTAALFAFVYQQHQPDKRLLLIIPFLGVTLGAQLLNHIRWIGVGAAYLREVLTPALREASRMTIPSHEDINLQDHWKHKRLDQQGILTILAYAAVLIPTAAALILSAPDSFRQHHGQEGLWWIAFSLSVLWTILALSVAATFAADPKVTTGNKTSVWDQPSGSTDNSRR
jgi:hypothetical protein